MLLAGGNIQITGLQHDKASGKTTVKWSGAKPENGVVVYRSDRTLTGDELFFAEKHIFPAGTAQGIVSANTSGKVFYRVAELTPYRRVTGQLSAEKSVEELDKTPPAAIKYNLIRQGAQAFLTVAGKIPAEAEKLLLLSCNTPGKSVKVIADSPVKGVEKVAVPENLLQGYVALAVADKAGNYVMPERWFYCGAQPDFNINGSPLVSRNKDVALSDRYMLVGKTSTLSFTLRNNGGAAGKAQVSVKVKDASGSQELFKGNISIAPGGKEVIPVKYAPQKAGKAVLTLAIDCANDINPADNGLQMVLYNLAKPLYIIWYGGNVMDLEYANYASVHVDDRQEFARRGGKNLVTAARSTGKSGEEYFKRVKSAGAAGMQLDEIGGRLKATKFLPAIVDFETRHPELLSAVWHIGNTPQKEVIQALQANKIDLIMLEIYYKDGTPAEEEATLKSLRNKLEKLRTTPAVEKMLIGLGTHRNYLGWEGSPAKHAGFIEKQIQLVREILPMTPGIAFYSSDADAAFLKQVDEMCRKYFLEQER